MTAFVFRLNGSRALLSQGEGAPTDRARICLEGESGGMLVLAGKLFSLGGDEAIIYADQLSPGVHTPVFFVRGKRYEGAPLTVGGGYMSFLPPTHAQLGRLEQRLETLEAAHAELAKRLCAAEARMQDTNIF